MRENLNQKEIYGKTNEKRENETNIKNEFIVRASIGFGLGILIGTVIAAITGTAETGDGRLYLCSSEFVDFVGSELVAFLIQSVLCGVQGVVGMGGAVVYAIEEWSTLKATLIHFCAVMGSFYLIALFLRWISFAVPMSLVMPLLFMVPPYVLIWLINYLAYRQQVKQINQDLYRIKAKEQP